MLELKNIRKVYQVGDTKTVALNDISIEFRKKEFVAILGASGSGKTTALNIIGGLDRYDSGDLIIKGKHTKDFKEREWDAYRNNSVGFVFQSYNLITHLSIVKNVELGMTLSGVETAEKRKKALEVLERVGLKEHLHKKPNQLSGGQMQRVAIARALANDPEILLCDEPTGALDSVTSVQIMDLIKEIASDRLVIMVTHNPELANTYANRIVKFKDGNIESDTNPYSSSSNKEKFYLKKTKMSYLTAVKLSFNNIMTKKGRTALTMLASSIGIIGIAVILSISTGFQSQIDKFQEDTLSQFPILITQNSAQMDKEQMEEMRNQMRVNQKNKEFANSQEIYLFDSKETQIIHKNNFTDEYIEYVKKINPEVANRIGTTRLVAMNLVRKNDNNYIPVSFNNILMQGNQESTTEMSAMGLTTYPENLRKDEENYLEQNYDILFGAYPSKETELVLVVDNQNRIDINILKNLGFDVENKNTMKFNEIVNAEFKLVSNNDFYKKTEFGTFLPNEDYKQMYDSNESILLTISGIVRLKQDASYGLLSSGIAYSDQLSTVVVENAKDSEIVKAQIESSKNVITMESMTPESKEMFLSVLGGNEKPFMIMVYPKSFENKKEVLSYLDAYNENKEDKDVVIYNDLAGTMIELSGGIIDGITIVLIAFAAISLVVSLVMIGIITYISVIERTKEIGVLKALGARKIDITRVFDAETFILGLLSGLLGVFIAWIFTFPINSIIEKMTGLVGVSHIKMGHAVILVIISTILTILGGHIPAKFASKKDAVEALRSE